MAAQLELQVVVLVDAEHRVVEHAALVADVRHRRGAQEVILWPGRGHGWLPLLCVGFL
ncbi:hypothetical protein D3C77_810790 [compost metagenome]